MTGCALIQSGYPFCLSSNIGYWSKLLFHCFVFSAVFRLWSIFFPRKHWKNDFLSFFPSSFLISYHSESGLNFYITDGHFFNIDIMTEIKLSCPGTLEGMYGVTAPPALSKIVKIYHFSIVLPSNLHFCSTKMCYVRSNMQHPWLGL